MRWGSWTAGFSRGTVLLASGLVIASSSSGVMADDAGMRAFFREQFGVGASPQASISAYASPETRPLIVRPHRRTAARKPDIKVAVGPSAPVTIYNDETLRPGDAVMTTKGLRVFMGGHGAPYTDTDFVALSEVDGLPRQVEKALVMIDKAPHG